MSVQLWDKIVAANTLNGSCVSWAMRTETKSSERMQRLSLRIHRICRVRDLSDSGIVANWLVVLSEGICDQDCPRPIYEQQYSGNYQDP